MDFLKCAAVIGGSKLLMKLPMFSGFFPDTFSVCMISTFFAVLGHCFPVFYGFKGGKGILVGALCILFMDPPVFAGLITVFVIAVAITKYISVGSMLACISYPVFTYVWHYAANALFSAGYENPWLHALLSLPLFLIAFLRHFGNIRSLWNGDEKKFYLHKKGEDE